MACVNLVLSYKCVIPAGVYHNCSRPGVLGIDWYKGLFLHAMLKLEVVSFKWLWAAKKVLGWGLVFRVLGIRI